VSNSFVDFYDRNNIVPVRQVDSDSMEHSRRRTRLYSSLSVPMELFEGKNVLEVGGGTGDNASVCLDFKPNSYTLLDASKSVLKALEERFKEEIDNGKVQLVHRDVNDPWSNSSFDFVIAEACIPGQSNPSLALESISKLVASKGFLVITTQSAPSLLPETLRRILALQLKRYCKGDVNWGQTCLTFFASTLEELSGMSRDPMDWVLDVLIHPWHNGNQVFEFETALSVLDGSFSLIGISPSWLSRDHWYKKDTRKKSLLHESSLEVYKRASLFLMDRDERSCDIQNLENSRAKRLYEICSDIYNLHLIISKKQSVSSADLESLHLHLDQLLVCLKTNHNKLRKCISEFVSVSRMLEVEFNPKIEYFANSSFKTWWGRGQQYLAFQKSGS